MDKTVMVIPTCVHDEYRVSTCRPGRGHIVAAARLQLVTTRFNIRNLFIDYLSNQIIRQVFIEV